MSLIIDCRLRLANDSGTLCHEINVVILKLNGLIELDIHNVNITDIPYAVCTQKQLRKLRLDNNRLERLPDNCFVQLLHLVEITADFNEISFLQVL